MPGLHFSLNALGTQSGILGHLNSGLFGEGLEESFSKRFLSGAADPNIDHLALRMSVRQPQNQPRRCGAQQDERDLSPNDTHRTPPLYCRHSAFIVIMKTVLAI